jgi:hypothetical protein
MPNNNLILRTLISPWITPTPDTTKSSVLKHIDVDNNFIYLRGELIYTATTVGNLVTLKKINGNDLSFNVGSGGGTSYWSAGTGTNAIVLNNSNSLASGTLAMAMGTGTTASGTGSHTQGFDTTASGDYSHAEGAYTVASGLRSHAEGGGTDAIGNSSHAEGTSTIASGFASHAEGNSTTASGANSHAEGAATRASGQTSHAEGYLTVANGYGSHSGGYGYNNSGQHRVVSYGDSSFAHFRINQVIGDIGAYADQSTILGGLNHNIDSSSTNSTILGGSSNRIVGASGSIVLGGQNITGTTDDTVYTPNLEVTGQAYTPIYDNLTGGTSFVPNWDNSNVQILTLSGNTNVSGGTSTIKGGSAYTVIVKQSNGGSHTITWDSTYKWEEGNPPTLSTADGSVDIITFICDGTSLYGLIAKDFQ